MQLCDITEMLTDAAAAAAAAVCESASICVAGSDASRRLYTTHFPSLTEATTSSRCRRRPLV